MTLDPRKGERAVLVKDAAGDYAVLVGRWLALKKHNKETAPSECFTLVLPQVVSSKRITGFLRALLHSVKLLTLCWLFEFVWRTHTHLLL